MAKDNIPLTAPVQVAGTATCSTHSLEFVYTIFNNGQTINLDTIVTNIKMVNNPDLNINTATVLYMKFGLNYTEFKNVVSECFTSTGFTSFQDAINAGNIVLTNYKISTANTEDNSTITVTHSVAVVGYTSDGELIYVDPLTGNTHKASESNFIGEESYQIVITGTK